jgi:hypothetical protein
MSDEKRPTKKHRFMDAREWHDSADSMALWWALWWALW